MRSYEVATANAEPLFDGERRTLGNVLVDEREVPEEYFIPDASLPTWEFLKGAKSIPRVSKRTGHEYVYSEGGMSCPDDPGQPSRTILTSESGRAASRSKHLVRTPSGRCRRLVPEELELLQGFPRGWTDTGMSDANRAFCMGNALVVGIPERIGQVIRRRHGRSVKK